MTDDWEEKTRALFGWDDPLPSVENKEEIKPRVTLADIVDDFVEPKPAVAKVIDGVEIYNPSSSSVAEEFVRNYHKPPNKLENRLPEHQGLKTGYKVLSNGDQCYFCDNDHKITYYSPPLSMKAMRGSHGDMIAYKVCPKCLGRCQRKPTLNHAERLEYIESLESRGSVRGRVAGEVPATVSRNDVNRLRNSFIKLIQSKQDIVLLDPQMNEHVVTNIELINGKIHMFFTTKE